MSSWRAWLEAFQMGTGGRTREKGPVLLEEADARLQAPGRQAPLVVKAVQRIQPRQQHQVQRFACTHASNHYTVPGGQGIESACGTQHAAYDATLCSKWYPGTIKVVDFVCKCHRFVSLDPRTSAVGGKAAAGCIGVSMVRETSGLFR